MRYYKIVWDTALDQGHALVVARSPYLAEEVLKKEFKKKGMTFPEAVTATEIPADEGVYILGPSSWR